jgi:hypothetical protein
MNVGKPVFAFTPHESALLMGDIGRSDIAAVSFIADAEACLHAFAFVMAGGMSAGLPQEIAVHLDAVVRGAAQLRGALYGLPDDIAMLIDLHLLADGAQRRVAADFSQLVEPLEDIAGAIVAIQRAAKEGASRQNMRLEDHLVRALSAAFRNRLKRKPAADNESGFPAALAHILEFAGRRLPSLAAMSAAITPKRLRELVGARTEPERSEESLPYRIVSK